MAVDSTVAPVDLLITQYRNKPRMRALLQSYLDQFDEIRVAIAELRTKRFLGGARGAQLDRLGRIVGALRQGLGDADYETLVRAYIRAGRSEGKPEDLFDVFRLVASSPAEITLEEHFPMAFVLGFFQDAPFNPQVLRDLLEIAEPQATRGQLVCGTYSDTFQFAVGTEPVTDLRRGFGDANEPAQGGRLVGVI
jgi:hypothetical protein